MAKQIKLYAPQKPKRTDTLNEQEKSLLAQIGSTAWNTFTAVGATLDTPQQILRSGIMWLKTGDSERFDDIFKAMIPFRQKLGVQPEELPSWEDILEEYGMDEGWERSLLALGIGVAGDIFFMPSIGTLGKVGEEARKAGQLGATWIEQAAKNQRLAFRWPLLSKIMGDEVAVSGKPVVEFMGATGALIKNSVFNMAGYSPAGAKIVGAAGEAMEASDEATLFALDRTELLREVVGAADINSTENVIKSKETAELLGMWSSYLKPVSKEGYIAGIHMGMTNVSDRMIRIHTSLSAALAEHGSKLSEEARALIEPFTEAIARNIDRAVRYGSKETFDYVAFGPKGRNIAVKLAEKLGLDVLPASKFDAVGLADKMVLYVEPIVGPGRSSKYLKALKDKGAEVIQAGLAYGEKNAAEVLLSDPKYLASKGEVAMLRHIYQYLNEADELTALSKGYGQDAVQEILYMAENSDEMARIFNMPVESRSSMEMAAKYIGDEMGEIIRTEKEWGSPIIDLAETGSRLKYLTRQFTNTGFSWFGNMMKNRGLRDQFVKGLAERNGVVANDIIRRYSVNTTKYVPWAQTPKYVRETMEMLVDNADDLAAMKANGLAHELVDAFSGELGFHYSMMPRNPLFGDMQIGEINEYAAKFGAPKMLVDDPFTLMAIRRGRMHRYVAMAETFNEAAEEMGVKMYGREMIDVAREVTDKASELEQRVQAAGFGSIEDAVTTGLRPGKLDVGLLDKLGSDDLKTITEIAKRSMTNKGMGFYGAAPAGTAVVPAINTMRANKGLQAVAFDPLVAKAIQRHWDSVVNPYTASTLYKTYMGALRWWKGWQLFPWPAYWGRNAMTDMYRAVFHADADPVKIVGYMKQGTDILKRNSMGTFVTEAGKKISHEEIRRGTAKIAKALGMTGGAMEDIIENAGNPQAKGSLIQGFKDAWQATTGGKDKAKVIASYLLDPAKFPMGNVLLNKIGKPWETSIRMGVVLDQIYKGATVEAAVDWSLKWLIDYGDLSNFEKKWGKAMIPFYAWSRKNIPLTIESIFRKPYLYDIYGRTMSMFDDKWGSDEELAAMPSFIEDKIHLRLPTNNGEIPQYLIGLGLPEEDVFSLMSFSGGYMSPLKKVMASMSPLPKMLIELSTGKNLYFDQPIAEYKSAFRYMDALPDPVKEYLDFHKYVGSDGNTRMIMNPYKLYMLSQFRAFTEIDKVADERKTIAQRIMMLSTGARVASVDIDYWGKRKIDKYTEDTLQAYYERGMLGHINKYYKPSWMDKDELPTEVVEALKVFR